MPRRPTSTIGIGQRQASRLKLSVRGRLTSDRGTQLVELLDLSQSGARLALSASHRLAGVRLEWLEFAAPAQVVWQDRRLCGVRFDEALPLEWVSRTRRAT